MIFNRIQNKNHGCASSADNIDELKTAYYQKIITIIKSTFSMSQINLQEGHISKLTGQYGNQHISIEIYAKSESSEDLQLLEDTTKWEILQIRFFLGETYEKSDLKFEIFFSFNPDEIKPRLEAYIIRRVNSFIKKLGNFSFDIFEMENDIKFMFTYMFQTPFAMNLNAQGGIYQYTIQEYGQLVAKSSKKISDAQMQQHEKYFEAKSNYLYFEIESVQKEESPDKKLTFEIKVQSLNYSSITMEIKQSVQDHKIYILIQSSQFCFEQSLTIQSKRLLLKIVEENFTLIRDRVYYMLDQLLKSEETQDHDIVRDYLKYEGYRYFGENSKSINSRNFNLEIFQSGSEKYISMDFKFDSSQVEYTINKSYFKISHKFPSFSLYNTSVFPMLFLMNILDDIKLVMLPQDSQSYNKKEVETDMIDIFSQYYVSNLTLEQRLEQQSQEFHSDSIQLGVVVTPRVISQEEGYEGVAKFNYQNLIKVDYIFKPKRKKALIQFYNTLNLFNIIYHLLLLLSASGSSSKAFAQS